MVDLLRGRAGSLLQRRPGQKQILEFLVPGVIVCVLLAGAYGAILNLRSVKYLVALIALGVLGLISLLVPRKKPLLVFLSGFTMPFYLQVILVERDQGVLALTGTFLIVMAAALVTYVSQGARGGGLFLVPTITSPQILLICGSCLSFINTTDRTQTFIALANEVETILVFLLLVNAIREEAEFKIFLRGFFLAFGIECCIYVVQNILGYSFDVVGNVSRDGVTDLESGRLGFQRGTFGTAPAVAATYFASYTLVLIGIYLCRAKVAVGLNPVLGAVMGTGCLILAAKRGPWLGFALGILALLVLLAVHSRQAFHRYLKVLLCLSFPVLVLLPVFLVRVSADHGEAYEERMNLNRVAWEMYEDHPLIGVGWGTYDDVKRSYLPEDWSGWLYEVHNQYILTLAERGLVGLALALILYGFLLREVYGGIRRIRAEYRPFQASLLAGIVPILWEMFWNMWYGRQQTYLLWFLVIMGILAPRFYPGPGSDPSVEKLDAAKA